MSILRRIFPLLLTAALLCACVQMPNTPQDVLPAPTPQSTAAPAATPKAVVTRLHAEVQKALQGKDVRERMTAVGGEVLPGPTEQFAQLIQSERRRYEKLVREANIKPD